MAVRGKVLPFRSMSNSSNWHCTIPRSARRPVLCMHLRAHFHSPERFKGMGHNFARGICSVGQITRGIGNSCPSLESEQFFSGSSQPVNSGGGCWQAGAALLICCMRSVDKLSHNSHLYTDSVSQNSTGMFAEPSFLN